MQVLVYTRIMPKSALFCGHANEMPNVCPCKEDCYCKEHSCRPKGLAEALEILQRNGFDLETISRQLRGTREIRVPHCDQSVLHSPGECSYCDECSDWQKLRELWKINFTGHSDPDKAPCPSERLRPAYVAHRWVGNQPTNIQVPLMPPTALERLANDEED